ncbi:Por secretion system C-terminal sorting domain-containing protein [Fibrobacter sp. UWT2]|uniref:glycoside hydrolase family 9 protein n=1 Tax=Fibrobacter sp. UWT2 TaxID=1896224 RepID=UPI000922F97D|nr:glycoside hydrolase family 9 protein [Fibrobacter sp. UWT2]SHK66830.1 Por secretion system C-terminal sorting domain-containing protein [Fibrobacter sp. UWT2]
MRRNRKLKPIAIAASLAFSATAAMAATTPYDLIRPTWPLSWDSTVFSKFDTTVTKKTGMLPKEATPASFKAGAMMPDTLDQAYFDAINTKISPIRVNQAGYLKSDKQRQFYYVGSATEFEVVDADGKSLSTKITGTFTATETATKSDWTIIAGTNAATNDRKRYKVEITGPEGNIFVGKIPQNVPTEKRLRIKVGDEISSTFIVSDDVYTMAKDATLKFFGIQRSGNSESWFHGPSHVKDGGGPIVSDFGDDSKAFDESRAGTLAGGWYDCGDHLKESQTMAYAFMTLAVMSATNPAKDVDHYAYNQGEFVKTDGVPDVLREAKHGADFFLRAYEFAKGVIDDMPVSVGNFGSDHGWWGRPEAQDYVNVEHRGGPAERDVRLGELGANISSEIAAGLAILSKDYAKYDKKFADSCLVVAEKMYAFAKDLAQGKTFKNNKAFFNTPAYNGNNEFVDDLALASVALLYATGKKDYADDMIRTTELFASQQIRDGAGFFAGGWFATENSGMLKNVKNTSWANAHSFALYALYKLILADKTKATTEYGLTEEERLNAIEDCLADMIVNLGDVSGTGTGSIVLPKGDIGWKQNTVSYDPTWYAMQTDQTWIFSRYHVGNIFEVLAYADVAADIEKQGVTLPAMASTGLKASEMRQLGINQLNYLLGVNPWDISFVYGIGDKNEAHPHHRASNPEGRNTSGFSYKYNCPVGGLLGGLPPSAENSWTPSTISWEDYHFSETCLDASATLLSALTIVSNGGSDYYEKKCDNCKSGNASPVIEDKAYVAAFHYTSDKETDTINIRVSNESLEKLDSVVAYIYFDATEEDISNYESLYKVDSCRTYDIAGFNRPCADSVAIRKLGKPQKIEDSFDKDNNTYSWAQPIFLGNLDVANQIMIEFIVNTTSKVKVIDGWSFISHYSEMLHDSKSNIVINADSTDAIYTPKYDGIPQWTAEQGEIQVAPKDPYIVLRSKGKLVWGYGPGKTTDDRVGIKKITQVAKARMQVGNNRLYVLTNTEGTKTVKIFDMLGNQLMVKTFDGTRAEVNLANLPHRGALIARVMQNGKVLATQSIKVK